MDRCLNGWMNGWMDGWSDGEMDERINSLKDGCVGKGLNR